MCKGLYQALKIQCFPPSLKLWSRVRSDGTVMILCRKQSSMALSLVGEGLSWCAMGKSCARQREQHVCSIERMGTREELMVDSRDTQITYAIIEFVFHWETNRDFLLSISNMLIRHH